jgi:hypothetical protein
MHHYGSKDDQKHKNLNTSVNKKTKHDHQNRPPKRYEQRSRKKHCLLLPKTATYYDLKREEEPRTPQQDQPSLPQLTSKRERSKEIWRREYPTKQLPAALNK